MYHCTNKADNVIVGFDITGVVQILEIFDQIEIRIT